MEHRRRPRQRLRASPARRQQEERRNPGPEPRAADHVPCVARPGPRGNRTRRAASCWCEIARMELEGAVCLVTGATSGIGRATALRLARRGARVLALGRDETALAEVTARTRGASIRADLTDPAQIGRAAREAGAVDVLVNN